MSRDELYEGQIVTFSIGNGDGSPVVARVLALIVEGPSDYARLEYYGQHSEKFHTGHVLPAALSPATDQQKSRWVMLKLNNVEL